MNVRKKVATADLADPCLPAQALPSPVALENSVGAPDAGFMASPAVLLQARLEMALTTQEPAKWPLGMRLAIILGSAAGLWTAAAFVANRLLA